MQPVITVIIPIYNGEMFIERAVKSVLMQPVKNIEILVVNDGSTDQSVQICRELETEQSQVRVLSKENGGVSSARNLGIECAKGKYIAFLDCDDWWQEDIIDNLIAEKLLAKDSFDVYQFAFREVDTSERLERIYPVKEQKFVFEQPAFNRYDWLSHCAFLYRSDFLRKWGLKYPIAKNSEDGIFVEEVLYWAGTYERINKVLFTYFENLQSCVHSSSEIDKIRESARALVQEQQYFQYYHIQFDVEPSIVWQVANGLPKLCAKHRYNDVIMIVEEFCFRIIDTRKDIRFRKELWSRIIRFKKHPRIYWLEKQLTLGIYYRLYAVLFSIPGVSKKIHYVWNKYHRHMRPISK